MKLSQLKQQGIADRACGSFAQLLKTIREIDAEEARNERLAQEFAWEDYADELTREYEARQLAAVAARNSYLCEALDRMEAEGVRDAINAKVVGLGGYKWVAA